MKNEQVVDRSVRLKVINDCQWTCNFCHNEGTELPEGANGQYRVSVFLDPNIRNLPPVGSIKVNPLTLEQLDSLRDLGIDEVHLTGGEPTLHPDLPELVSHLATSGFKVKMTSNGQTVTKRLQEIIAAGVSGITFSILSLNPEEFLTTQNPPKLPGLDPLKWAQRMIDRGTENIKMAKALGIDVKINTAVLGEEDYPRVDSVRRFAEENDITLILLPSLGEKDLTQPAVFNYARMHGEFQGNKDNINNANGAEIFLTASGSQMRAKYLRELYPDVVCRGCEHNGKSSCLEKFYGIRMEFRDGDPYVRLCLQQSNPKTIMPLSEFTAKKLPAQLGYERH